MERVLLVGRGFLGSELARLCESQGGQVYVADKEKGEGEAGGVLESCALVDVREIGSLRTWREQLLAELGELPPVGFFCVSSSRGGQEVFVETMGQGVKNLREVFPEICWVFCSSTSVYPQEKGEEVTEESPVLARTERTKVLLESEARVLASGGIVARLSNLYGPGRSVLLERLRAGKGSMEEEGERLLNHIHRDDAAEALWLLAQKRKECLGQVYNVTDSLPVAKKKLYRALCSVLQWDHPKGSFPRSSARPFSSKAVSNARLLALGWEPRYPTFFEALEDILPTLPFLWENAGEE